MSEDNEISQSEAEQIAVNFNKNVVNKQEAKPDDKKNE